MCKMQKFYKLILFFNRKKMNTDLCLALYNKMRKSIKNTIFYYKKIVFDR